LTKIDNTTEVKGQLLGTVYISEEIFYKAVLLHKSCWVG